MTRNDFFMFIQVEPIYDILNFLLLVVYRNTPYLSIEPKMLLHSHRGEECIKLWAVSYLFLHFAKSFDDIVIVN